MFLDKNKFLEICQTTPDDLNIFIQYNNADIFAFGVSFIIVLLLSMPIASLTIAIFNLLFRKEQSKKGFKYYFKKSFLFSIITTTIIMPFIIHVYTKNELTKDFSNNQQVVQDIMIYAISKQNEIKKDKFKLSFYQNLFKDEKVLKCEMKIFYSDILDLKKTEYDKALHSTSNRKNINVIEEINQLFK